MSYTRTQDCPSATTAGASSSTIRVPGIRLELDRVQRLRSSPRAAGLIQSRLECRRQRNDEHHLRAELQEGVTVELWDDGLEHVPNFRRNSVCPDNLFAKLALDWMLAHPKPRLVQCSSDVNGMNKWT